MNIIRRIQKTVKSYEVLLINDPEESRKNCKEYLEGIEKVLKFSNMYFKMVGEEFYQLCDLNIETFTLPENNIFQKIKRECKMLVIRRSLQKTGNQLAQISVEKQKIEAIRTRLNQYKYFCK